MKRIAKGKLYDTNEAITVCSWREMSVLFGNTIETQFTLYREAVVEDPVKDLKLGSWGGVLDGDVKLDSLKGEFFLAIQIGGAYSDNGRIQPVCVDEARRIFEEHVDTDYDLESKYKKYFGVDPQKTTLKQLKEAFEAGAEAKRKQYDEEAKRAKPLA